MKKTIALWILFVLFISSGGIWISLARFLPDGLPRNTVIVVLGIVFVGLYLRLLLEQMRQVLGGGRHLYRTLGIALLNLILLIVTFAWMYQQIGIIDNTRPGSPVVHSFTTSVYYSVVTFTTLGYGDFYPQGAGRFLAALEAITGYLILGIVVSTSVYLIHPEHKPSLTDEGEDE